MSRTLTHVDPRAVLIKENVETEIAALKNQPGRHLALVCGPDPLGTLFARGLSARVPRLDLSTPDVLFWCNDLP